MSAATPKWKPEAAHAGRAPCRLQPAEQAHLTDAPNIVLYETSLNSNILKMNDLISSAVALMTTFAELINQ